MKYIFCLLVVFAFPAYGAKKMTPEEQNVQPISQTNDCKFIKTVYFEVSSPSKIHYYAAKNTVKAGGDSYAILTAGEDDSIKSLGFNFSINTTNIAIYNCELSPKHSKPTESGYEKSEALSYIDEIKALAKLRDDGILTEEEFQQQKAKVLTRDNPPPAKIKQASEISIETSSRNPAIESLIEQLHSSSTQQRTMASKTIFTQSIHDVELYEEVATAIRNQLANLNKKSPGTLQEEIAWHTKALATSGNEKYLPLLDELSNSAAKKVAKYAKESVKLLAESANSR